MCYKIKLQGIRQILGGGGAHSHYKGWKYELICTCGLRIVWDGYTYKSLPYHWQGNQPCKIYGVIFTLIKLWLSPNMQSCFNAEKSSLEWAFGGQCSGGGHFLCYYFWSPSWICSHMTSCCHLGFALISVWLAVPILHNITGRGHRLRPPQCPTKHSSQTTNYFIFPFQMMGL